MATINGTPGNDTLTGTVSADSLFGLDGNDSLLGLFGRDSLEGGGGSDTLDGGIGIDTMLGGTGNDLYVVSNTADTVTETAFSGIDTVESSVSYTLGRNQENLTLIGVEALDGTGNTSNNTIIGNEANNILYGEAGNDILRGNQSTYAGDTGNDILYGGDGDDILFSSPNDRYSNYADILYGGSGNDTLNGGRAYNTLDGGIGDDTYVIVGDRNVYTNIILKDSNTIIESANSGIDTVQSEYSYTIGSNLENLTLTGSRLSAGTGNALNNTLIGNDGNNILDGRAGDDKLNGGEGNDTFLDSSGSVGERDTLTGGAGRDTFFLGNVTQVFYDDRNRATAGKSDYALITDFNEGEDAIALNGRRSDYRLAPSPAGLPAGTAIYRNKPTGEPDELLAIVQSSTSLNLNGNYFKFTSNEINLSTLDGSNGFIIEGIYAGGNSGFSVSGAGDINGDGFDDIIVGATGDDRYSGYNAGESYIVFGSSQGFSPSFNLNALNGNNGFVVLNLDTHDFDFRGELVSNAGDVNGDGFDDIIIGAVANNSYSQSYVVFGKQGNFDSSFNLSDLNGTNGFIVSDFVGVSISSAGDINGDGFDDIIVGAYRESPNGQNYAGESYVVFGSSEGFSPNLSVSALDGSNGFKINGIDADDRSGSSVSSAGDINSDGFDDIIIGAFGADPNGRYAAGESYVVFGKQEGFDPSLNLSVLNGSNGFKINGIDARDYSGVSVSSVGDVNGDGIDDIIIGASNAAINEQKYAGESYVVFGSSEGFSPNLNLSALNGSNGFKINGIDSGDSSGNSVSNAGDVNGDGFNDLLIGARGADRDIRYDAGESYVVFGKAGGFSPSLNLFDISGNNGFVINGIDAYDSSGRSVSSAGDINGDGFDDIIIGAPGADPNAQNYAGESYVIFGRDFTGSVTRSGTAGNDRLTGTAGDDILVGGLGNDRLSGGKGSDVLNGGAGNDIITFGVIDRRSNGGSGTDTLRIDGRDSIDLTTIANNKLTSFEIIDITGTGNNNLAFTRLDVLDLSDTASQLIVNGNAGDKVTSTQQGWAFGGTTTVDSVLYQQYTAGAATLLVDADITQAIIS